MADSQEKRWTRCQAETEIARYRASGLKMKAYAEKAGVNLNVLRGWAAHLSKTSNATCPTRTRTTFVEVSVAEGGPCASSVISEIVLDNGIRLTLRDGAKLGDVRALLEMLVREPC